MWTLVFFGENAVALLDLCWKMGCSLGCWRDSRFFRVCFSAFAR